MRLLFDIGATNTRLGISRRGEQGIQKMIMFPTSPDFSDGIKEIARKTRELTKEAIETACGGIAGPLDERKSMIVSPGNIPGWCQRSIKRALEDALQTRVYLENDVALVGLGEATSGAGRGYSIVAYVTFSSGFGATRIVNGGTDVSRRGFEPAFQIASYSDVDGGFKPHHYLRFHVSGKRLETKYGRTAEEIDDPKIWDQITRWMAVGINNVIVFWSPGCVVMGGPILNRISFERLRQYVGEAVFVFPELPEMKKAELGDYGGLFGALRVLDTFET